jgi:Fur family ferric uptake transcriptional regulator
MVNLAELLRKKGLKATAERVALLSILQTAQRPLSIPAILAQDRRRIMNQATAYRGLNVFVRSGIARRIDLKADFAYYELADPQDHHHLVCRSCGRVEDFRGCDFPKLARQALARSKNFRTIEDHSLELFGLCKACSN